METSQLITREDVKFYLNTANIHFPEAGYTQEQIEIFSVTYRAAFLRQSMTKVELTQSGMRALEGGYFPKIKDVLVALTTLRDSAYKKKQLKAEQLKIANNRRPTETEVEYGRRGMAIIWKQINGELSQEESAIKMDELNKEYGFERGQSWD